MLVVIAEKKRTALYFSICSLLVMVAAVSAVSARDPSGVTFRIAMVMLTVGAALWLPWQALIPATLAIWIGPNLARSLVTDNPLFSVNMLLELPGLVGLAASAAYAHTALRSLEEENLLIGAPGDELAGLDSDTGVYHERMLRPAIEGELVRSRRFERQFALVLVGLDEMRQRFDYRDEDDWRTSFNATAKLLRTTRVHIDRAYRFGVTGFALLLPEAGPKEVQGLVRRLSRVARHANPPEGAPGGPLPVHFGATFFPQCATTVNDLLRRAEVAMRIAEKSPDRVLLDSAEAPDMPSPETLRQENAPLVAQPETQVAADSAELPEAPAVAADQEPVTSHEPVASHLAYEAAVSATMPEPESAEPVIIEVAAMAPQGHDNVVELRPANQAALPDDDFSELLKRLDETADLLHSMRTGKSA